MIDAVLDKHDAVNKHREHLQEFTKRYSLRMTSDHE